jgi:PAS domain S-box-containing protein/putative nucleotidyltransferase with HDIG domain
VEYERVEERQVIQQALSNQSWDVILCDYSLPHLNAMDALEILHASGLDIPFIVVSGTIDEETAVTALKAGADDFIVKGKFARLGPAIERGIREASVRHEHRLAEERVKYHARLLKHINDAVIATDPQFRITSWNRAAERIYGWTAAEVMNRNADEILRSGLNKEQQAKAQELLKQMSSYRSERIHARKNGSIVYVEEDTIALTDDRGRITGYVSVNRDITDRKMAEIQIQQQVEQLSALRNIDKAILSNINLHFTLSTILSEVRKQLQVDAADILLLNSNKSMLEYAAGQGFRTHSMETTPIPIGESFAGRAITERRLIKIENLTEHPNDPFLASLVAEEGFVFYCAVPLITKTNIQGTLEIFHRSFLQPNPDWIEFLQTLAGQAAIAIDNATLFENLQHTNQELIMAYDTTIEGWSRALDLRDRETEGHTVRVTEMTIILARRLGFGEEDLIHIRRGALLHDIGKMGVPDNILLKPDTLTAVEWLVMRKHPQYAYELLKPIVFLERSLDIPYCHHEKWDGTGYPRMLKEEEIPLAARLFAVVDVWDALTSDRPYRSAWSEDEALTYIGQQSGHYFDPEVVGAFLEMTK